MRLADHYTERFHALAAGWKGVDLEQRKQALAGFLAQGFPKRKREEWRFTDVTPIAGCPFEPVAVGGQTRTHPAAMAVGAPPHHVLGLVNSVARAGPQDAPNLPDDVVLTSYSDSPQPLPQPVRACFGAEEDDGFLLMNAAFLSGGVCLYVPPGRRLSTPIYLDLAFTREAKPRAYNLRNMLVLGEGAEAEVIEHYHSLDRAAENGGHADLWNIVTRVALAPGAKLHHSQSATCGRAAYPLISVQATQQAESHYRAHVLGRDTRLGRQEFRVKLCEEGADAELDCLHMLGGDNYLEYRALIEHAVPRTRGLQLYRGMMAEQAHGVFNGRVRICAGAEDAEARQDSSALLLSDKARADASPTLEIYTDAVKCNHGATVGRLDENALFYLQSRALDRQEAEALLRRSFARVVLERLPETTRAVLATVASEWAPELSHYTAEL